MTQLLLTVAGLVIAGLLSPGPNFVLVSGRALSSLVFSRPMFQRGYQRIGFAFDATFGALMIGLGIKVALSER